MRQNFPADVAQFRAAWDALCYRVRGVLDLPASENLSDANIEAMLAFKAASRRTTFRKEHLGFLADLPAFKIREDFVARAALEQSDYTSIHSVNRVPFLPLTEYPFKNRQMVSMARDLNHAATDVASFLCGQRSLSRKMVWRQVAESGMTMESGFWREPRSRRMHRDSARLYPFMVVARFGAPLSDGAGPSSFWRFDTKDKAELLDAQTLRAARQGAEWALGRLQESGAAVLARPGELHFDQAAASRGSQTDYQSGEHFSEGRQGHSTFFRTFFRPKALGIF